jgi:hypothetical protein
MDAKKILEDVSDEMFQFVQEKISKVNEKDVDTTIHFIRGMTFTLGLCMGIVNQKIVEVNKGNGE